jgi:hypothetical protein
MLVPARSTCTRRKDLTRILSKFCKFFYKPVKHTCMYLIFFKGLTSLLIKIRPYRIVTRVRKFETSLKSHAGIIHVHGTVQIFQIEWKKFLVRAKRARSLLMHIGNIASSNKQIKFTLTSGVRAFCLPTQSLHGHLVEVVPLGLWKTTWNFRTIWKTGIQHVLSTETTVLQTPNIGRL